MPTYIVTVTVEVLADSQRMAYIGVQRALGVSRTTQASRHNSDVTYIDAEVTETKPDATLQGQIETLSAAIAAIKSAQAAKPVRVKREKKAEPKL